MVLLTDVIFLTAAVVVTAAGAMMALLVNMVLPVYYQDESKSGYVPFPTVKSNFWDTPDKLWMRVGRSTGDIKTYPYLVSISSYPYVDSKEYCLFLCTGFLAKKGDDVVVYSGSGCNLEKHKNVVVRGSSDYFWKEGKVSKIASVETRDGWVIAKLEQDVGKAAKMNMSQSVPVNATFYALGWGAEIRPSLDILADEKFFIETWGSNMDVVCRNTNYPCNFYFYSHQISSFFIEAMDDSITCCYEGFITHTNEHTKTIHGALIGKPLVYVNPEGNPIVIAMQHKNAFRINDTISYYTVFSAVAPKEDVSEKMTRAKTSEQKGGTGSNKENTRVKRENIGRQSIVTRIFRVQNVKKFFLQWFRYTDTKTGEQYTNYDPELWKKNKKLWVNGTLHVDTNEKVRRHYETDTAERALLP